MSFKKNILFIGIGFYDYDLAIIKELEKIGYHVDYFCEVPKGFKFRYYLRKNDKIQIQKSIDRLSLDIARKANVNYDFVFVIKGEYLTNTAIDLIRKKNPSAKWILYLWDSLHRIPESKKIFNQFDEIYSFDRLDCTENIKLKFNPLFYRNEYHQDIAITETNADLYFLGWYHSDRMELTKNIISFCNAQNLRYNIKLYCGLFSYLYQTVFGGELKESKSLLIHKPISLEKNIKAILNSKCCLDIAHPFQNGLTMRTIELVGAKKKIITTNSDIINYDFYNSDNILILDRKNPVLTLEFFKTPYKPIDEKIIERYSLFNWINRMIK